MTDPFDDIFAAEPTQAGTVAAADQSPRDIAAAAVANSLETSAFLLAEPAILDPADEQIDTAAEHLRISLTFGGPAAGTLCVSAPLDLGQLLATNMLGCDGDASTSFARDALRELVNVAAGAMMPDLVRCVAPDVGDSADCPLELPRLQSITVDQFAQACRQQGSTLFDVEGKLLAVAITLA